MRIVNFKYHFKFLEAYEILNVAFQIIAQEIKTLIMNTIFDENILKLKVHNPWKLFRKQNIVAFEVIFDALDKKCHTSRSINSLKL